MCTRGCRTIFRKTAPRCNEQGERTYGGASVAEDEGTCARHRVRTIGFNNERPGSIVLRADVMGRNRVNCEVLCAQARRHDPVRGELAAFGPPFSSNRLEGALFPRKRRVDRNRMEKEKQKQRLVHDAAMVPRARRTTTRSIVEDATVKDDGHPLPYQDHQRRNNV